MTDAIKRLREGVALFNSKRGNVTEGFLRHVLNMVELNDREAYRVQRRLAEARLKAQAARQAANEAIKESGNARTNNLKNIEGLFGPRFELLNREVKQSEQAVREILSALSSAERVFDKASELLVPFVINKK